MLAQKPTEKPEYRPFLLDEHSSNEPTELSLIYYIGDRKTDNTTLKHFYDVNYKRSDKNGKSNFLEGIFDAKSNKSINMML